MYHRSTLRNKKFLKAKMLVGETSRKRSKLFLLQSNLRKTLASLPSPSLKLGKIVSKNLTKKSLLFQYQKMKPTTNLLLKMES
jgi:hypothetical protein